jgi:7,8-dihydropterin-6-yl-methyl-4-(beta-D-ribofuranosyl)aminobenzene 5'-phosphate synthase
MRRRRRILRTRPLPQAQRRRRRQQQRAKLTVYGQETPNTNKGEKSVIISVLVENTSPRADLGCEHALSLYIATKEHRLLFDTGASGLFAQNAHKLGIDLADVDTVILSHGHYDHGGGFKTFLDINKKAALYLREGAFDRRVARESGGELRDIGLTALLTNARFTFTPPKLHILR